MESRALTERPAFAFLAVCDMSDDMAAKRKYDRAKVMAAICEHIADGESLRSICETSDMPSRKVVFEWIDDDPAIRDQYARAMSMRAEKYADEVVHISDTDPDVNRARVRIDARKWAAGKLAPAKYGDRLNVDANVNATVTDERSPEEIKQSILGKLASMSAARGPGKVS
jgi:hypothetical protein